MRILGIVETQTVVDLRRENFVREVWKETSKIFLDEVVFYQGLNKTKALQ